MPLLSEIAGRLLRLPVPAARELVVDRDLPVVMDDGVVLLADRYAPPGHGPAPTVLVRSPYGRSGAFGFLFGRLIAERGLQVVVQSVRGTFGSGGSFDPFDERRDGLATLRWLRERPWHAGPVGGIGPSYMGLVQWAIADELDALAPSVTASQFRGMALGGGSLSLDAALSWTLVLQVQERRLAPLLLAHGLRHTLPRLYGEAGPIAELDERAFGAPVPYFREWMDEMSPDSPYWAARDFSSSVGGVEAPVQLTGGWYDIFLPWMVEDFQALRAAGRRPQLIIGPWTHTSPAMTGVSLREGIAWMRAHLLGDERMVRDAPVRVYVTGERGWRELSDWPPPGAGERTLYLHPGGALSEAPPGREAEPSRYRYDPSDPTPALGGAMLLEREPVRDNRPLEARPDVLTFTTAPVGADLDALGPVRAEIHLRSSRGHTDLFVRICDVEPGGASLNVCDGLIRLTPDEPPRDGDRVAAVRFELWPTAHRFAAGHRIRVQVSSGAHPRYARNPGTGEDPARATTLVAADQEVFHDAERRSSVTITVAFP
ncbi:MAG TPA: CocE/NonD family hydrolase [Thermoleophilaceae bacterium]